ncbi:succinylglutamate desuccinylase/aspartoacylase family protein [Archangium lipolyticum]|uniref:succinylglutamate desuccinylase/aspartoacylase family protein n=1 Tax=Archangium lipolyticum TaxID=2970465 RepID=UPI00214A5072|nr:M14 family metallopeptidase [Archangium lipolyticum]
MRRTPRGWVPYAARWYGLILMMMLPLAGAASAQAPRGDFALGPIVARPGTAASGQLPIPDGVDPGTFIPITLLHGARPGPVLALIAGVHGSEYTPILALQRVRPRIDPSRLAGTVILVHAANVPAFFGRTVYIGPVDGKNLNRSFPGKPEGTITERIAHALTEQILRRADFVVDLHAGDANEALHPWTGYYAKHGTPEVIARSRQMAIAFGVEHIVMFPMENLNIDQALYTGAAAVALGKPSFDVEVGGLGRTTPEQLALVERGVLGLLRHLRMLDGPPAPAKNPIFIERRANLKSEVEGLFYPTVEAGQRVKAGTLLGYVTDFFGNRIAEHRAPHGGVVLVLFGTPPVRPGETVAVVGEVSPGARMSTPSKSTTE